MTTSNPFPSIPAQQRLPSPARLLTIVLIIALWIAFTILVFAFSNSGVFGLIDFDVYRRGAVAVQTSGELYQGIDGMVYLYPPLLAMLLTPFIGVPHDLIWILWYGAHVLALAGIVFLVQPAFIPRRRVWLWLSPLFFAPIIEGLYIGQISVTLLILFVLAWAAHRSGRPGLAGAILALATWLKVYPALVILLFLWWRDWRTIRMALVVGVILTFFQILAVGAETFLHSFQVLSNLSSLGQEDRTALNVSIVGFTYQLFGEYPLVQPIVVSPALKVISRYGLSAILVLVTVWLTRRNPEVSPRDKENIVSKGKRSAQFDLSYSLAILTAMLISPTLWVSGMPPVLFCIWLVWRNLPIRRHMSVIHWLLLIVYFTISIYYVFILGYVGDPLLNGFVLSFGTYALLILWGIHVVLLRKVAKERS